MGRQYVSNVRRYPPDLPLAGMDIAIGLLHLFSSPSRMTSPAFAVAKQVADPLPGQPMTFWGIAYLLLGAALGWALFRQHNGRTSRAVAAVRTFGPALFVMWALMYAMSGLHDVRASFLGVPPYLYLAYRHHFAPASPVK